VWRKLPRWLIVAGVCIGASTAGADPATGAATRLRLAYEEMSQHAGESRSHRALRLESSETSGSVNGEAFGLVDHSFAGLSTALADPGRWCDIMILHINNKACRASATGNAATITLRVARKYDQSVEQAQAIEFSYRLVEATPQYLAVQLDAANGPLGTSDYRIVFEAIPGRDGRSFVHLSYSYRYGFTTRMAMGAYFATVGRGKVGFTETGHLANGEPEYIAGMRGLVERNTMRYFLAVEAYLGVSGTAGPEPQFEARLRHWFDATELHPRQLHEVDRQTFLEIKLREHLAAPASRK